MASLRQLREAVAELTDRSRYQQSTATEVYMGIDEVMPLLADVLGDDRALVLGAVREARGELDFAIGALARLTTALEAYGHTLTVD